LTNCTDHDVKIVDFRSSCGCTQIEPRSLGLPPRTSAPVTFTINLHGGNRTNPIGQPELVSVSVVPVLENEPRPTAQFTISGRIKNPLRLPAQTVVFDEDNYVPEAETYESTTLPFEAAVPLRAIAVRVEPPYASVRAELRNSNQGVLRFCPASELPADGFDCGLWITLEPVSGQRIQVPRFPIAGTVVGDLQVVPKSISFEPGKVGERRSIAVALRSRSGRGLSNIVANPGCRDTSVTVVRSDNPDLHAFEISHRIQQVGEYTTTVDFVATTQTGKNQKARVQLSLAGLTQEQVLDRPRAKGSALRVNQPKPD